MDGPGGWQMTVATRQGHTITSILSSLYLFCSLRLLCGGGWVVRGVGGCGRDHMIANGIGCESSVAFDKWWRGVEEET